MENKTILIADDEPAILRILKMKFEAAGYKVLTACDGMEALEIIERLEPDALITDNKMPRMTGVELVDACEKIRENKCFLIIMLSSYASLTSKADREWISSLKNTMFISKPFSPRHVLKIVEDYLEGCNQKLGMTGY